VARRFFALPAEVKTRYAVRIGGRGRLAGVEANGDVEGVGTRTAPAGYPTWMFDIDRHPPSSRRWRHRSAAGRVISAPFLRERLDAISVG
jgi:hypothetical protein